MSGEWSIRRYNDGDRQEWDSMVESARNSTFLFQRDYMDYHSDRFSDCSLIAMHKGKAEALLAANIKGTELYSHGGLTYGGWILPRGKVSGIAMSALTGELLRWCRSAGITAVHYKPMPYIYATEPSQEDLYALWQYGAERERVLLSSVIDREHNGGFDYLRRRYLKRVEASGVRIEESPDLESYWRLLEECLEERHQAQPVHTLSEIRYLQSHFPDEIKLYTVNDAEGLQGGVLLYRTAMAEHCQYIASTAEARSKRYMPYLFAWLIMSGKSRYFDFGTSNNPAAASELNAGLLENKFGMGGRGVAYEQYLIRT